jgi:signal transduction histidine kinase
MDIARDMPVVFIDIEKVRRILENLISNAIKFVDEQGVIDVSAWYVCEQRQPGSRRLKHLAFKSRGRNQHNRVRIARLSRQLHLSGGFLVLVVKDNGCGIKEEDRPFVFDRFVQGRGHPSIHHSSGSGLGLAVVKELAELHGGNVELDCAEGKGCSFTVRIAAECSEESEETRNEDPIG